LPFAIGSQRLNLRVLIIFAQKLGALIAAIQQNNNRVSSRKLHRLSSTKAVQFFAAYKGVWNDYPVIQLILSPILYL
jgi:hypothetical protein